MQKRYCIITSTASVSALGTKKEDIFKRSFSDKHYLTLKEFNEKQYWVGAICPKDNEGLENFLHENKNLHRTDRSVVLSALAALQLKDALGKTRKNICVSIGSSRGATALWEEFHTHYLNDKRHKTHLLTSPLTTLAHISTEVASFIGTQGLNIDNSTTCSTGIQSAINGLAWLKAGFADIVIAGGAEAPLTPFTLAQVEALNIYGKNLEALYPCRPLTDDAVKQNTFALGEAASLFVMQYACKNEISDFETPVLIDAVGYSFIAPPSYTGIDKEGTPLYNAMKMALKNQTTDAPIDLVLMHAPGTIKGDEAELNAVHKVFEGNLPNLFSNKWKLGHTYAASAAMNIELACLCLKHNICPAFPYNTMVKNKQKDINKIMINATGFGGNAASIILSKASAIVY